MQAIGKVLVLDGQRFNISLPEGGGEEFAHQSLWEGAINACGDSDELWHWKNCYSWCLDKSGIFSMQRMVRGNTSARRWSFFDKSTTNIFFGFRPVLWPISKDNSPDYSVLKGIPNGTVLRAFTLLCGKKPCRTDKPQRYIQGRSINFTDKFYGDEYLIPWVVFQGKAMAALNLLSAVSWDILSEEGYCAGI